jgi:hypothetical protein
MGVVYTTVHKINEFYYNVWNQLALFIYPGLMVKNSEVPIKMYFK